MHLEADEQHMFIPSDLSEAAVLPLLKAAGITCEYHYFDTLESTNIQAAKLSREGHPHGTLVVAETQSQGRGRLGRSWFSPFGENLYLSVVLKPSLTPAQAPMISLVAGVAVAEATAELLSPGPILKWPNDLLWQGKKLSGILTEMEATQQVIGHVILGIGVNVNTRFFSDPIAATATSMAIAMGRSFSRGEFLVALVSRLQNWLLCLECHGAQPVIERWLAFVDWLNKPISVKQPHGVVEGIALGLDSRGLLRIRLADGSNRCISAGDVWIEGAY